MRLAIVRVFLGLGLVTTAGCATTGEATGKRPVSAGPSSRRLGTTAKKQSDQRAGGKHAEVRRACPEAVSQDEASTVAGKDEGLATYYADQLSGHRMANGQAYNPKQLTMAHRSLPFGTLVRVVRISTGAAVTVCVTDRGPFGNGRRIADLSREAARRLDMIRAGVVEVRLEVLGESTR